MNIKIKLVLFSALVIGFIVAGVILIKGRGSLAVATEDSSFKKVIIYKSPTCGCCVNYISILKSKGFDVEVIETEDMNSVKKQYGIPADMESCHTSLFGDYVVEGHMPLEAVEKLLNEKPDIYGIALPDMPAGSLGMPGVKSQPFTIYSLTESGSEVFLIL